MIIKIALRLGLQGPLNPVHRGNITLDDPYFISRGKIKQFVLPSSTTISWNKYNQAEHYISRPKFSAGVLLFFNTSLNICCKSVILCTEQCRVTILKKTVLTED